MTGHPDSMDWPMGGVGVQILKRSCASHVVIHLMDFGAELGVQALGSRQGKRSRICGVLGFKV